MTTRVIGLLALSAIFAASGGAGLIVDTTAIDLTPFGFGKVNPVLTLQNTPSESGCVAPDSAGSPDTTSCNAYSSTSYSYSNTGLVSGPDKYTTPTLRSMGITGFSDLLILFNVNDSNNASGVTVTLDNVTLGLFNGADLVYSFSLEQPVNLTMQDPGQGKAGFKISIDPAQTAGLTFNADYRIGMAATILDTNDGAESFTVVSSTDPPVPEPATAFLIGTGLITIAAIARRLLHQ